MESKKEIRSRILKARENLSKTEREKAALLITERIAGHQWFYGAESVLGFAGYGSEIDTKEILKEALHLGKKLYLPKVQGAEMEFYRVVSLTALIEGYKGIPEPKGDTETYVYTEECADKTLMLMPGAVFDVQRNRIGYGKGYYDKYLADKLKLQLRTIAIGFQCQMLGESEQIPADEHDIRPYQVICL